MILIFKKLLNHYLIIKYYLLKMKIYKIFNKIYQNQFKLSSINNLWIKFKKN